MEMIRPFADDDYYIAPSVGFEALGPAPQHFTGLARVCLSCNGTGVYEDDGGYAFGCSRCHGSGVRNGLFSYLEWYIYGQPLGVPFRLIREVGVITQPRLRLAHPGITPKDGVELAFKLALQEVCALLKGFIEFEAADIGVSNCTFYSDGEAPCTFPSPFHYYTYTGFDFPVRVCIEQCRLNFALSGSVIVVFEGD